MQDLRLHFRTLTLIAVALATCAAAPANAEQPTAASKTLLEQLSQDTQHVYEKIRGDIVRVQLPTPQWLQQVNAQQNLLQKWGAQLTPEVRQQFLREQELARAEIYRRVGAVAPSQPVATTQSIGSATQPSDQANNTTPGALQFPGRNRPQSHAANFILIATGMIVDRDGHAIVPFYVDRKSLGDMPLRAVTGDGRLTSAKFIGSDQQANITIVQIELRDEHPPVLARSLPQDGSLALVFAPEGGARLAIWNNAHPEPGLVVTPNGEVAGFSYNGHFLEAGAAMPIVDQIISTGQLRRAVLGVRIREVGKEDVLRKQAPNLGDRSAMYVLDVNPDSPARRGGLQPGDFILAIGDRPVVDKATFAAVIATGNGKTDLHVLRGNSAVTVLVDLQPK